LEITDLEIQKLQSICESIAQKIPCQISIMGQNGAVIASSISDRTGQIHSGAAKVVAGEVDSYDVTAEMALSSKTILEGCNLPLTVDGQRIASVGVAAPLEKAREFAAIAQTGIDALLEGLARQRQLREGDQRFRDFADCAADWFWEMDRDLCFSSFTGKLEEVIGLKASELIGMTRQELYSSRADLQSLKWKEHLQSIGRHQRFTDFQVPWQRPDGAHRIISLSGKPVFGGDGLFWGYRGVGRDVTQHKKLELLQQRRNSVLEQVAQGCPLKDVLTTLVTMSEELHKGMLASVLLLSKDGQHLETGAALSLPAYYTDAIDNMRIGPEVGSCGAAAYTGKVVIVSDISTHPFWSKARGITAKAGLKACWSQPILSSKKVVLGTFAMYYKEVREPTKGELDFSWETANLTGIAIEKSQAEAELTLHRDHLQELVERHTVKLAQSEERFRTIAEGMSDWIWEMDSELRFSYFSDRFGDIIGADPSRVIGKTREEIIDKKLPRGLFEAHLDDLRNRRVILNYVYPFRREDGVLLYFKINGKPIYGKEGAFRGYRGTASDVTKETLAEQALEHSNQRFKDIAEIASDWFWETDPDLRFSFISERFFEVTGVSRKDVMGKTRLELITPGRWERERDQWERHKCDLEAERPFQLQYWIKGPSNKKTYLEIKGKPSFSEGGKFLGFRGVGTDITSIVETNEDLKAAKLTAELANKAKSEFLSSMSHELRTPLNAILGFAQLLESSKKEPLSERQQGQVHRIIKGGEHLLALINEVLDLAKIEAGKLVFSLEVVKPKLLIKDCLTLANTLADKRNITISDRTDGSMPDLWADHLRAKQVLLNIISNSVKYNKESGSIWLDAERSDHANIRLKVTDTGPGIPAEKHSALFQPFQRLGAETSEVEGTGIGLALAKKLMEEMGGAIGFESECGKGSTFWVDFPISEQSAVEKLAEQEEGVFPDVGLSAGKHLLLYVEDNPANLALMEGIVEDIDNLDMISAVAAEQGLTLAQEYKPDVIVLDINLPGMSGLDAVRLLKQSAKTKAIPVLALTANAMPADIRRGLDAGFTDYLTKPVDVMKFVEILQHTLGEAP